jgi:hypothetical protein
MQIDHLVLRRLDGTEVRANDIATTADTLRAGSVIMLTLPGSGQQLHVRVTRAETSTVIRPGDGNPKGRWTVFGDEVRLQPVAANEA